MKKTFSERVADFKKSLLGGGSDEGDGKKKGEGEGGGGGTGTDDGNDDDGGGTSGGTDDDDGGGDVEKSYADATEIMTALVGELQGINKSLDALLKRNDGIEKSQVDFGESIVQVAEMLAKIGNQPNPVKAMIKSLPANGGTDAGGAADGNGVLTPAEFAQAQKALAKSFAKEEISLFDSSRLEREMQKAMVIVGYQMAQADRDIIKKALSA
jgi:hypothetical protein